MTEVGYHGQPVLKQPVWGWEIPVYFFVGGAAGASAGLAFLSGARGNEVLARRAWAVALGGIGVTPPLLISDLGRPERFLNMLRMFKPTSPMSVGSWILTGAGGAITVAAVHAWTGLFGRLGRPARPAAALLGLPLSTYTAALLANTAVPVWHDARATLPFVFGASAAMSAGALAAIATPVAHAAPARRLALAGAAMELATEHLQHSRLGELGEVYDRGTAARCRHASHLAAATGAALLAARGARSRPAAVCAGLLLSASAVFTRLATFKAGFASASDPKYVVTEQRRRLERSA